MTLLKLQKNIFISKSQKRALGQIFYFIFFKSSFWKGADQPSQRLRKFPLNVMEVRDQTQISISAATRACRHAPGQFNRAVNCDFKLTALLYYVSDFQSNNTQAVKPVAGLNRTSCVIYDGCCGVPLCSAATQPIFLIFPKSLLGKPASL